MYAIIRTGGRQYRAEPGLVLDVERLPQAEGEVIDLTDVLLLVGDDGEAQVGQPIVANAVVKATVVKQGRARKVFVWKYKPKLRYRRRRGHRQYYTQLRIDSIAGA
ncbi:50S ribosomal protein L21 [Aggregatilinea lenta]|uniref:50S ribosomal protein L21 n=1 Tax=Aggregatilinea lenta TaxID=913108 RepID=UPI000E5B1DC5|nr:50S ribosomal protein L21 [Aggregatilinea lenta]